jgi:hypothetical protein
MWAVVSTDQAYGEIQLYMITFFSVTLRQDFPPRFTLKPTTTI